MVSDQLSHSPTSYLLPRWSALRQVSDCFCVVIIHSLYNDLEGRSDECSAVPMAGSRWSGSTPVTEISGNPRSRTLFSTPCSADSSTISPERPASPSSTLAIVSPSNHSDQRPPKCPFTRIS
jgi:hypothetical protein